MVPESIASLAVPLVVSWVFFLSFSSQFLFKFIEPGPLNETDTTVFNGLVTCLLLCYYRSCVKNPGHVPDGWKPESGKDDDGKRDADRGKSRWCRKCNMPKPPRAHHCKTCKRCIPKMDHHCPWTRNCVSHVTFPHFLRFLFYAVAAMCYLEYYLYVRAAVLWGNRMLPSYLGPSHFQLIHLLLLLAGNSLTLFALAILLVRTLLSLGSNTTTIESWEIQRHETLLRRSRHFGGFLEGPDGVKIRITKQEFPYDIGIWKNITRGMGSSNPIAWFWPFAASPTVESGVEFEVNGFEDESTTWPPPDPDRIPRKTRKPLESTAFTHGNASLSNQETLDAFRERQQQDMKRWVGNDSEVQRRRPFLARLQEVTDSETKGTKSNMDNSDGEEGWRNSEGERLADFGVDEVAEFYDEDDLPLGEILRRRRAIEQAQNIHSNME